jgi:hypothetical protein
MSQSPRPGAWKSATSQTVAVSQERSTSLLRGAGERAGGERREAEAPATLPCGLEHAGCAAAGRCIGPHGAYECDEEPLDARHMLLVQQRAQRLEGVGTALERVHCPPAQAARSVAEAILHGRTLAVASGRCAG